MVEIETGSRIPIWRTLFSNPEVIISAVHGLSNANEIWFADRLQPSEESGVTQSETGSEI